MVALAEAAPALGDPARSLRHAEPKGKAVGDSAVL